MDSKSGKKTKKQFIFDILPRHIDLVSSGGQYLYSQRQLFYSIRPEYIKEFGEEPKYRTFQVYLIDYENAGVPEQNLYRDARGSVYFPHTGETIPLGTLAVADYQYKKWHFSNVLYLEKEGFLEALKQERFAEKWDCAIVSGKGQATMAVKDFLDMLGGTGDDINYFVVHDCDAPGTIIAHALQHETQARGARNVEIVNLGLDVKEALEMGLVPESVSYQKQEAVGDYVDEETALWLQTNRVELNAMRTEQFLAWLDNKMYMHGNPKIIPPEFVSRRYYAAVMKAIYEEKIKTRILEEAGFDKLVSEAVDIMMDYLNNQNIDLAQIIFATFTDNPYVNWKRAITEFAQEIAD